MPNEERGLSLVSVDIEEGVWLDEAVVRLSAEDEGPPPGELQSENKQTNKTYWVLSMACFIASVPCCYKVWFAISNFPIDKFWE